MKKGFKTQADVSAEEWTKWALNHGLSLPYDFININRGLTIMKKLLEDSGSDKNMTDIMTKAAMKKPWQIYKTLVGKDALSTWELLEAGRREIFGKALPEAPKALPVVSCQAVFL